MADLRGVVAKRASKMAAKIDWDEEPWYPPHPACEVQEQIKPEPEEDNYSSEPAEKIDLGFRRCTNRPVVAWDPKRHCWVCAEHATSRMTKRA